MMKTTRKNQTKKSRSKAVPAPSAENLLARLEFYRHAYALLPDEKDPSPGIAFFVDKKDGQTGSRFCTCAESEKRTCPHIKNMTKAYKLLAGQTKPISPYDNFKKSIWYKIAQLLVEGDSCPMDQVQICTYQQPEPLNGADKTNNHGNPLKVFNTNGQLVATHFSLGEAARRFLERCSAPLEEEDLPHRASIRKRLSLMTLTDNGGLPGQSV